MTLKEGDSLCPALLPRSLFSCPSSGVCDPVWRAPSSLSVRLSNFISSSCSSSFLFSTWKEGKKFDKRLLLLHLFLTSISTFLPLLFDPLFDLKDSMSARRQSRLDTAVDPEIQEFQCLIQTKVKTGSDLTVALEFSTVFDGACSCGNMRRFWQKWYLTANRSSPYKLCRLWWLYGLFRFDLRLNALVFSPGLVGFLRSR